jgi:hypothetical protein
MPLGPSRSQLQGPAGAPLCWDPALQAKPLLPRPTRSPLHWPPPRSPPGPHSADPLGHHSTRPPQCRPTRSPLCCVPAQQSHQALALQAPIVYACWITAPLGPYMAGPPEHRSERPQPCKPAWPYPPATHHRSAPKLPRRHRQDWMLKE